MDLSVEKLILNLLPGLLIQNPPKFLPGVSQDVTQYFIVEDVRDSTSAVPTFACSTSICSYTYSPRSSSLPNSHFSVSVSAQNTVGRGQMCTPQTEIGMRTETHKMQYK